MGLNYLPLRDNPFEEAGDRELHLAFLKTVRDARRDGNGPVYIHCRTGSDRAGLAVAIYRVIECGWDTPRALDELRHYQPYYMAIFFHRYPAILRDVEAHRADWLRQLDEMPDPPIQRPPQAITQSPATPTTQPSG
jgi:protein-tyrosine phosphatase